MPTPGPRKALQPIEPGSVILSPVDVMLAARLCWVALDNLERRDGAVPDAFRAVTRDLCDAAEQARKLIEAQARRSTPVAATTRAPAGFPNRSSDPDTWPTTTQASAQFGVSKQYLRRLAVERRITVDRRGGKYRYDPADLAMWAVGRAVKRDDQAA